MLHIPTLYVYFLSLLFYSDISIFEKFSVVGDNVLNDMEVFGPVRSTLYECETASVGSTSKLYEDRIKRPSRLRTPQALGYIPTIRRYRIAYRWRRYFTVNLGGMATTTRIVLMHKAKY